MLCQNHVSRKRSLLAVIALRAAFLFVVLTTISRCHAQQLVFIHYSNDTAPAGKDAENHRITIEGLKQIGHPKADSIADNLRAEPQLMANALAADRNLLRQHLPGRLGVALCELDNAGVRNGVFDYWLPGDTRARQGEVESPRSDDYVFDENPLATAEGLKASLRAVAALFPPQSHQFILVTQSHGSNELALTVKLARKHENTSFEDFKAMFHGDSVTYDLPSVGVTKAEYFNVLRTAGVEDEMQFPLVILETCKGTIDAPLAQELPKNVDMFFSSGQRCLEFRSLPYDDIFRATSSNDELISAFDQQLQKDFLRISRKNNWPIWIWSLPLAAFLVISLLNKLSRRMRKTTQATKLVSERDY